jgi:diguanylate cyclase (GGDEF)-like protein/PAS domain S-box-containing protein
MSNERLKVLLVDDDEDDYIITRTHLEEVYRDEFDLEWVSAYERALHTLVAGQHSICLLDFHLGERTGLELLREAIARGCPTPIILLTGKGDREIDVEAMKAGAADYLVKGRFDAHSLERSIRYTVGFAVQYQRTLAALRRSEERYALAVRGANDGLWDWDLTTDRVYYAPRWKSMLGYDEYQIGDRPDDWLSRLHPLDAERVRAEIAAHQEGQTPQLYTEHRMLHDDGKYRWVLTRGLIVRDAQGRPIRMAGSQCDITQRKAAEDRLYHNAFHDTLTGLPNRALLIDRLGLAILRRKRNEVHGFAVLFLDLDGFKLVNDSLGHAIGDQLLIAIGRRLEGCVREGDTVARLGGDEFVILAEDIGEPRDAYQMADRALDELQSPFALNGRELVVAASVGIVVSGPNYDRAEDVLRDADIAMYQAKAQGKAGHVIFDKAMHTVAVTRLKLETDLRYAAVRQEFRLHYQPIVSIRTGQIISFEALLRWNHPECGLVPPDEFIPVAEETKLILPIGLWVLREAAGQLRQWQLEFPASAPLAVAVNLSCRQFLQPDLIHQIERILLETGLDARCLRLEITESALMERLEPGLAALARLKALGVRLVMDDFGKGYSSFSYLHQFPFDTLKIDRTFIARLGTGDESAAIVRTIIAMAKSLGLDVVAEGVETADQLTVLRKLGCEFGQGYFFSRPLSGDAAGIMLAGPPRWLETDGGDLERIPHARERDRVEVGRTTQALT